MMTTEERIIKRISELEEERDRVIFAYNVAIEELKLLLQPEQKPEDKPE